MIADDLFWEEASTEPLSMRAWLAATLRKLRPTRSGALSFVKGISRVRNFRELRNVFRKRKINTHSFDADAGDDSDALPPSVVTHLKWKEGKLSDGGRWWGPFRSNRKQKYAEIQKIIGETFLPTDAHPPHSFSANSGCPANFPPPPLIHLAQETASCESQGSQSVTRTMMGSRQPNNMGCSPTVRAWRFCSHAQSIRAVDGCALDCIELTNQDVGSRFSRPTSDTRRGSSSSYVNITSYSMVFV